MWLTGQFCGNTQPPPRCRECFALSFRSRQGRSSGFGPVPLVSCQDVLSRQQFAQTPVVHLGLPSPIRCCSRLVELNPLAGRVHLVSILGQHGTPEESGRCAALLGVDVLLQGHDDDVPLRKLGLHYHPVLKIRESRSRKATVKVYPGRRREIKSCQTGRLRVRPLATLEKTNSGRMP